MLLTVHVFLWTLLSIVASVTTATVPEGPILVNSDLTPSPLIESFEQFKKIFNKTYATPKEEAYRREVFQKSLQYVKENRHKGVTINQFADLTVEEFRSRYLISEPPTKAALRINNLLDINICKIENEDVPEKLDLRNLTNLPPVRVQGLCGSCWAFTAVAVAESYLLANKSISVDLSEQELVDCVSESNGCNGGVIVYALDYIQKKGLVSEQTYPYQAVDGTCKQQTEPKQYINNWCVIYPPASDYSIQKVLADTKTAVGVALHIKDSMAFQLYNGQTIIRSDEEIPGSPVSGHGVNIVGFGTSNDVDYWIVRNSWGTNWGDHGYFYLERNKNLMEINLAVHVVNYPVQKSDNDPSGTISVFLSSMALLTSIIAIMII